MSKEKVIVGTRAPHITDCPICAKPLVARPGIVQCTACSYRVANGERMPRISVRDVPGFRIVNVSYPGDTDALEFKLDHELARMVADALV